MSYNHSIKAFEANQRLDKFILQQEFFKKNSVLSRSDCAKLIQDGSIEVNDQNTKPSYILKTGDSIALKKPPILHNSSLAPNPTLPIQIVFQNEHFIIIDKPAGILMHPSAQETASTISNWAIAHFPAIISVGENALRPGIVHRLDKDTSGLCVIAKTQQAFAELKTLFQKRQVQKTYIALVHGHIRPKQGIIDKAIARSLTLQKQAVVDESLKIRGKIREAITHYEVLQSTGEYDLVETKPKTGRMHQIRVHLFSIGHPIVGDIRYFFKQHKRATKNLVSRHLLHAKRLQFTLFGEKYDFSSPLPQDFHAFLEKQA